MTKPFKGYCQGCSDSGCWDVEPASGALISFCKRERENVDSEAQEPKEQQERKTVEELKEHLESLDSLEAVTALREGEIRKTALKAIDDRAEELALAAKTDEEALGAL